MDTAFLKNFIETCPPALENALQQAFEENGWFTVENSRLALSAIADAFLEPTKLLAWQARYGLPQHPPQPRRVGLVMAGNIPLAGFHDLLCVLVSGHEALVKLSEKDRVLLPVLVAALKEADPETAARIHFVTQLQGFDAVIATGSNNTARYFEYYFGKGPHIIRQNRHSVAVLTGNESPAQLRGLGHDIFRYFGLGCRNVSKLYLPLGYDMTALQSALEHHADMLHHNKWRNNFDYSFTLLLLNRVPHVVAGPVLLTEHETLASRIACLHYEYYNDFEQLGQRLVSQLDQLQCIVSETPLPGIAQLTPFGQTQVPALDDYADGVDSMTFLTKGI